MNQDCKISKHPADACQSEDSHVCLFGVKGIVDIADNHGKDFGW